ncbi:MAG: aldo/keto reductase [Coriobacteriales bacterium]|nr:aldo/keto reductase [Coriobacteriales bacterium]
MQYTTIGQTDIMISRFCLGCMGFGKVTDEALHKWTLGPDDTRAIIAQALDAGINFFDTAMAYSFGTSEEYVGAALRELAPRDQWVIATKYSPRPSGAADGVSGADYIRACVDNSLRRLGVSTIDLYYMHSWDYATPIEESLEALNDAVVAGKVRALGVSNCHPYQMARANDIASARGWARFEAIQSHMNLIFREDERELLQLCAEDGVSTIPYSALAAGRLSRKPGETSRRLQMDTFAKGKYDATAEQDNVVISRVAEVADKYDTSMTAVSLAWLLTKVTSPVVGATKPHHLEGPAAAADLVLAPEDVAYLEEPYVPHALVGVMAQNRPAK